MNNDASKPFKTDFTILLILRLKRTEDKMLPWEHPSPAHTNQTEWTQLSPGTVDGTETNQ